jgi:hypothetical protein
MMKNVPFELQDALDRAHRIATEHGYWEVAHLIDCAKQSTTDLPGSISPALAARSAYEASTSLV